MPDSYHMVIESKCELYHGNSIIIGGMLKYQMVWLQGRHIYFNYDGKIGMKTKN